MNQTLNIGIIGIGNIAEAHIEAYRQDPRVRVYAICNTSEERLRIVGEKYGVPPERRFLDRAALLALPELDAVSVCTWNAGHAECAIDALRAGKHVLCEKPMATSLSDALRMQQAAQESGKLLMIAFVRRFGEDYATLRDLIRQDFFGEFYYAKACFLRRYGSPEGWFTNKACSGGGPLIDLGVHVIDLVRSLAGNPRPVSVYGAAFHKLGDRADIRDGKGYVSASTRRGEPVFDVEDLAAAMIRFDSGLVLSVETSFTLNLKEDRNEVELFGTRAGAKIGRELELFTDTCGHMTNLSFAAPQRFSSPAAFARETRHFADCILEGVPCQSPAEDGVEIMRILDAIYESARTGHEVVL